MLDMSPGKAVKIFRNIRSTDYTVMQKRIAVRLVAGMPEAMFHKVTKSEIMEVIRWEHGITRKEET